MVLDMVNDIQKSYRKVLNCMSRPGMIQSICEESANVNITDIFFYKSTFVMMLMLLDAEVSFKIVSKKEEEITNFIEQLTYARAANTEEADYIFVLSDAEPDNLSRSFRDAKPGILIAPHKSATIIVEAEDISNKPELELRGPGIEEANYAELKVRGSWIPERIEKNLEYPLGVDVIFTGRASNIMCLPRTTQILERW